jgi:branched-chain amino acid transport system substrate-binding protein
MQATVLVRFLVEHRKYKRVAVLADDTPFGEEGAADVLRALRSAGATPVLDARFTPGRDVHTPVARAGQLNADAMIVWTGSEGEASRIVVETQKMGFAYQLALSGNLANSTFAKNATAQVTPVAFRDGILSVGPWAGPWFRLQRIVSFYRSFQTENSALAPVQAAQVYDATLALARAARERGTTPADLIEGVESLRSFTGAGVPLSFSPENHDGMDESDLAVWGFTKDQSAAGGEFFPEVDTGGGFFTVVNASLNLPEDLRFLARGLDASVVASPSEAAAP